MPDEAAPHARTWMVFGASKRVWGSRMLQPARAALATIANALVAFEPVTMLVRRSDREVAARMLDPRVEVLEHDVNDLWARDSGAVFVRNAATGATAAVQFNFNGWGGKQRHSQDATVARAMATAAGVPLLTTELVLEGGGLEVDGDGTAIVAESCVLNRNRNPGVTKDRVEAELLRLLGVSKVIWLPGGWVPAASLVPRVQSVHEPYDSHPRVCATTARACGVSRAAGARHHRRAHGLLRAVHVARPRGGGARVRPVVR